MKKYTLFVPSFFLIWILFLSAIIIGQENQSSIKNNEQFKNAQKEFVNENLIKLGKNAIERERFLIQQMRMLNEEIKLRVTNVEQVRKKYFDGLEERLQELTALKNRLNISSSSSLAIYLSELENKIKQTINEGRIDFRRQKVFEDGLQLLYIAEEMINLDPSSKLEENPKIAQELQSSRQKFLNTFGESQTMQTESSTSKTEKEASIFNLFKEWKNTNTVKYEARWTDILIIKNKLIKIGTAAEKDRMFKRELEYAVMSYNYNKFDLADRLFGEIIKRYDFLSTLDDLYFYKGESNFNMHRYFAAQTAYKRHPKNRIFHQETLKTI